MSGISQVSTTNPLTTRSTTRSRGTNSPRFMVSPICLNKDSFMPSEDKRLHRISPGLKKKEFLDVLLSLMENMYTVWHKNVNKSNSLLNIGKYLITFQLGKCCRQFWTRLNLELPGPPIIHITGVEVESIWLSSNSMSSLSISWWSAYWIMNSS